MPRVALCDFSQVVALHEKRQQTNLTRWSSRSECIHSRHVQLANERSHVLERAHHIWTTDYHSIEVSPITIVSSAALNAPKY